MLLLYYDTYATIFSFSSGEVVEAGEAVEAAVAGLLVAAGLRVGAGVQERAQLPGPPVQVAGQAWPRRHLHQRARGHVGALARGHRPGGRVQAELHHAALELVAGQRPGGDRLRGRVRPAVGLHPPGQLRGGLHQGPQLYPEVLSHLPGELGVGSQRVLDRAPDHGSGLLGVGH